MADSAPYRDHRQALPDLRWLCRVPLTLSEAKAALAIPEEAFCASLAGHRAAPTDSAYGGTPQRWAITEGEARNQREQAQFTRQG